MLLLFPRRCQRHSNQGHRPGQRCSRAAARHQRRGGPNCQLGCGLRHHLLVPDRCQWTFVQQFAPHNQMVHLDWQPVRWLVEQKDPPAWMQLALNVLSTTGAWVSCVGPLRMLRRYHRR